MSESVQNVLPTSVVLEADEEPVDSSESVFNDLKDKGSDQLPNDSLINLDNISHSSNMHTDESPMVCETSVVHKSDETVPQNMISELPVAPQNIISQSPVVVTNSPVKSSIPNVQVELEQTKQDPQISITRPPKLSAASRERSISPSTSDFIEEVIIRPNRKIKLSDFIDKNRVASPEENIIGPSRKLALSDFLVASPEENIIRPNRKIAINSPTRLKQGHIRRSLPCLLEVEVNVPEDPLSPYPKPPKSPITVQEWVNSIDLDENERQEEGVLGPIQCSVSHDSGYQSHHQETHIHDSLSEDNLNLGAEARNIEGLRNSTVLSAQKRKSSLSPGRVNLVDFRSKQSSFNSEASTLSTVSSLSSVESLLESRREDPEEILLALGFGGNQTQDPLARIPQRFLSHPSSARGVNLDSFLKQQEEDFQKQECSCLGYRGLTAMSPGDNKQASGIANKIIERLGESGLSYRLPAPTTATSSKPASQNLASAVMAATAFKAPKLRRRSESILDPANRDFLLKQGQEETARKNKKLILGTHTFNLNPEGDLIQHLSDTVSKNQFGPPMSPRSLRWKQTFKQMDCVSTVKETEETRDVFDVHSTVDNYVSSVQTESEALSPESGIGSSFMRRRQLIRQMRFEEEETRRSVERNVSEISKSRTILEHLGDELSSTLFPRDSFELEEISVEEEAQLSAQQQPSASVEVSMSESSGFAEEGHTTTTNLNPTDKAENKHFSFQVPPVEVTFWDSWDNSNDSAHAPTYRGRLSDPNIMCLTVESPDSQTEEPHRKGSFPQPSPKRWSPTQCNFLWPSDRLKASSPLSSSETTITNEIGNDNGLSGSEALSEGTLRFSLDMDGRAHSPYYQPHETAGSIHSDQSVASSSANDLLDISSDHCTSKMCMRSTSLLPQELRSHSGKVYQRSQSYPVPKELYSVLAHQQAFLEIQSLRLALEQYKSQGQRLESCSLRFLNYYPLLTEDQKKSLEYVQQLKTDVYREIGHMEAILNQHYKCLQVQNTSPEDTSPHLQRALRQMRDLLQEQSELQTQLERFALSDPTPIEEQTALVPTADSRAVLLMEAVSEELMLFRRQLKADQESMKTDLQAMLVKTKEEILVSVKEWMESSKKEEDESD